MIILFSCMLLTSTFLLKGKLSKVMASPGIYQGDLILAGNNVTVIEGQFDINGSIIVEENATLVLKNAVINFTQKHWKQFNITFRNPVNGNPRLQVSYATIISTPDFQFEIYFHGNSTGETFRLYVHNKIIAYDTSYVNITGSLHIWYVESYGFSTVNVSDSEIWYVKPHEDSIVSVEDSDITMGMENYGMSTASVSNCTIGFLGTYGSSLTSVSNCNITNMRPQGDHSSILTVTESNIDNFEVSSSCPITMSHCTLAAAETYGSSNVSISNCSVNGIYIHGSSIVTVSNQLATNGSITVEENATLILRNAQLQFTPTVNHQFSLTLRNPVNGHPRLIAYDSTMDSSADLDFDLKDDSTAELKNVTITSRIYCYPDDFSFLSISDSYVDTIFAGSGSSATIIVHNSTVFQWQNYGYNVAPEAQVYDSEITYLTIGLTVVNATISDLYVGFINYWNLMQNCSVTTSTFANPNITLTNTRVTEMRLPFYGNSTVKIINSTVQAYAYVQTRIQIFWYLDVHVVDDTDQNVPSANVTATHSNTTLAQSKPTDPSGWVRLTLLEKIKNVTGDYPVGNYTVAASYETYSANKSVAITGNAQIEMKLEGFIIPEFPSHLILPLFMIASVLVITIAFLRKKSTSNR